MTTASRKIRSPAHTRRAERFLGGPLEERRKDHLNEPDATMSTLAEALGVQKATVNYWMMRLGINYGRVAHYYDEEVRVVSPAEADLIDAIRDKGLSLEDVQDWDRAESHLAEDLEERGVSVEEIRSLTESDLAMLRNLKRSGVSESDLVELDPSVLNAVETLRERGLRAKPWGMPCWLSRDAPW